MDERPAHLVAAAEAVCTWVHAQRATWSDRSAVDFTTLQRLTSAPSLPPVASPVAEPVIARVSDRVEDGDAETTAFPLSVATSGDFRKRAETTLRSLHATLSAGAVLVERFWRVALAAAVVLACTGTARVYWPVWATAVKAQLAAAAEHVPTFEKPKASDTDRTVAQSRSPVARADATPKPTPRRSGRLQVDSNPSGARVVIDGQDRGLTPLTVKDLALGGHTVVLRGDQGEVQRTISIGPDKTTQLNEAIYSGWLHVSSPVELQIAEGTRSIRLDDSNQVLLPPGPHEMRFENRTFGFNQVQKFEVRPGDTTSISVVPPASKLSITASTPAEILIDGILIGGTPLADYALPVGTRELRVRNASGVERRMMLTVTVEPVRLDIDFSKP